MSRISIGRDKNVKSVEKITLCVDKKTQFHLLRLAIEERKSMSAILRDLVAQASKQGDG